MSYKREKSRRDMLVRAKLSFEGFDNATQPQKPHWESVQACPCFLLCGFDFDGLST